MSGGARQSHMSILKKLSFICLYLKRAFVPFHCTCVTTLTVLICSLLAIQQKLGARLMKMCNVSIHQVWPYLLAFSLLTPVHKGISDWLSFVVNKWLANQKLGHIQLYTSLNVHFVNLKVQFIKHTVGYRPKTKRCSTLNIHFSTRVVSYNVLSIHFDAYTVLFVHWTRTMYF